MQTKMIEFTRPDGKKAPGYLEMPSAGKDAPGVVVIQEWWGLNDQIKGVADRLAVQADLAGGRILETSDHTQAGGLAAARRPQHREELAVADVHIDMVYRDDFAELLDNVAHFDCDTILHRASLCYKELAIACCGRFFVGDMLAHFRGTRLLWLEPTYYSDPGDCEIIP